MQLSSRPRPFVSQLAAILIVLGSSALCGAQTQFNWNTTSGTWSATGDWNPAGPPPSAATTQLTFGDMTADYTATDDIGSGTFTLNSLTISNTGATTIAGSTAANTLTFAGTTPAITISSGAGASTISNGLIFSIATAVTNNSSNLLTLSGAETLTKSPTFGGTGNITVSGIIGAGTFTKTGSGTLTLSSTSNVYNNVTLSGGTLEFTGATGTGGATGNTFSVANGTTLQFDASFTATTTTHIFALAASATATMNVVAGTVSLLGTQMTGATATLDKTGAGILTFGSSGTATIGTIIVNGGLLQETSNRISATKVTINSGTQFKINDNSPSGTFAFASGSSLNLNGTGPSNNGAFLLNGGAAVTVSNVPNAVVLQSDTLVSATNNSTANTATILFSGAVSGPGNLSKTGSGTLVLNNASNTFGGSAGTTTVLNGTLAAGAVPAAGQTVLTPGIANVMPTTTSLTLGDGTANTSGIFDIFGQNQTLAGLATAGTGTANAIISGTTNSTVPTFTVNYNGGTSQTFNGSLGGTGSNNVFAFTKSGTGTLVLGGANTYTGSTLVSGGTLVVNGSLASQTITVSPGAFLDASNSSTGLILNTGGALTAGQHTPNGNPDIAGNVALIGASFNIGGSGTAATAALSSSLSLSGATVMFDLSNTTTVGGGVNDLIAVGVNLSLSGSNTIAVTAIGGQLASGNYTLFTYVGSLTGNSTNLVLSGGGGSGTRQSFSFDTTSVLGSVLLDVTGLAANLVWAGGQNSNTWDLNTTPNFLNNSVRDTFFNLDSVTFNNTGSNTPAVNIVGSLLPTTITVNATQDYTFSGTGSIDGSATLLKQGTGTLTILNNNTFSGTTTVSGGTLAIGNGGTTGSLGTGDLIDNATVTFNRSDDVSIANNISGTGAFTKTGTNNLTLTGQYTFSGTTTIAGGTLTLNPTSPYATGSTFTGAGTLAKDGTSTVMLTGDSNPGGGTSILNGTLQIGNGGTTGSLAGSVVVSSGATLAFNRTDTPSFAMNISGAGGVTQAGTGTVTLTGNPTYTGTTTVNSGTTLAFAGTTDAALSGPLAGTGTIAFTGTNTTTLSSPTNTLFTGTLSLNSGTVSISAYANLGATAAGSNSSVLFNGGTLEITAGATGASLVQNWTFGAGGGTIDVDGSNIATKQGNTVFGSGQITLNGTGTFSIGTNVSTFTGTVIVNSGIFRFTSNQLQSSTGVTVNSGAQYQIDDNAAATYNLASGASLTLNGGGSSTPAFAVVVQSQTSNGPKPTFTNAVVLQSDSAFSIINGGADNSSTLTLSNIVSGAGGLILTGTGTLKLTGPNTYTGTTTVNSGTLSLGANASLPATSPVVLNGGTLTLVTATSNTTSGMLTLSSSSILNLGTTSVLTFGNSSAAAWNGTLTINGYNGGTSAQFFVGADATGLTPSQLADITFTGFGTGAEILSNGQVLPAGTPIPEPTCIGLLLFAGLGVRRMARRPAAA